MKIKVLPPALQNQIAAGEVVENPASVLKELVENSLDAGATQVEVQAEQGGIKLLEVVDNGLGIAESDLELAVTRHATSKISSFADLLSISSYGFRGEALPSIASVSRFSLSSRPKEQKLGFELNLEFGQILSQKPVPMNPGTKVRVEDLFANVPARLKFLKRPSTEKKRLVQTFFKQALPHSKTGFSLRVEGQELISFYPHTTILDRLKEIWPEKILQSLVELNFEREELKVRGLTSLPTSVQTRSDRILLYVNNRPIVDKLLLGAIKSAYEGKILRNEFPQVVLLLEVEPSLVDVNVHPAKLEVRFAQEELVFKTVRQAILQALDQNKTYSFAPPTPNKQNSFYANPNKVSTKVCIPKPTDSLLPKQSVAPLAYHSNHPKESASQEVKEAVLAQSQVLPNADFVYLGQIDKTYLLIKQGEHFFILDQHVVHERILFSKLQAKTCPQKLLLMPLKHKLSREEEHTLDKLWLELKQLGFGLKRVGQNILEIRAVPELLGSNSALEFLQEVLAGHVNQKEELLKRLACKGSIKAGTELTVDEAVRLILDWQRTPHKEFCPHGRPTVIALDKKTLIPLFKRTS